MMNKIENRILAAVGVVLVVMLFIAAFGIGFTVYMEVIKFMECGVVC